MEPEYVETVKRLLKQGEHDVALQTAQQQLPGLEGEARARLLLVLARIGLSGGRLQQALHDAVEACDLFRAAGSVAGTCDALVSMATVLRAGGDHAAALDTLEQAEVLARELREPRRLSQVMRALGVSSSILRRHQHALSCLNEALELVAQGGTAEDLNHMLLSLYNAHNRQAEEHPAGSPLAVEALAPYVDKWQQLAAAAAAAGDGRLELMALGNRAITQFQCGDHGAASVALLELLPRYREMGMRPNEAICHNELGRCLAARGDAAQAREHFQAALALLRHDGSLDDLLSALEGLSQAEEALGRLAEALAALREVRQVEARKSDEAARAAVARRELRIELARLTSQWAQMAVQDPLTGLGNRRALERWLAEHAPRAERGEPLSLLLMDLDHFKQVNDHFGHDTGDEVLRRVATLIRGHCRSGDLAARYGGEEFLLALHGAPPAEAVLVAERLRASVAAQPWAALRAGLVVTVSVGVTHATEAADANGWLALADQRLYTAKIEGRDRVVSA